MKRSYHSSEEEKTPRHPAEAQGKTLKISTYSNAKDAHSELRSRMLLEELELAIEHHGGNDAGYRI